MLYGCTILSAQLFINEIDYDQAGTDHDEFIEIAGPAGYGLSKIFGMIGVILATINIFGGFIVTYRMLSMFKKKSKTKKEKQ